MNILSSLCRSVRSVVRRSPVSFSRMASRSCATFAASVAWQLLLFCGQALLGAAHTNLQRGERRLAGGLLTGQIGLFALQCILRVFEGRVGGGQILLIDAGLLLPFLMRGENHHRERHEDDAQNQNEHRENFSDKRHGPGPLKSARQSSDESPLSSGKSRRRGE
jgi:hypothetical protein